MSDPHEMMSLLRNPWGRDPGLARDARVWAGDRIEELERALVALEAERVRLSDALRELVIAKDNEQAWIATIDSPDPFAPKAIRAALIQAWINVRAALGPDATPHKDRA